jgi:WD40 repeat protein
MPISGRFDWRTAVVQDGVVRLLWHPTAPLIYTASLDGAIRVWDGRTGTCERKFEGHEDNILDMAITA